MSNSSIMSVRELIDSAFGDEQYNKVDFKLIQTILFLLARQLRILERRVDIVIPSDSRANLERTNLSVTEVKLRANIPRNTKKIKKTDAPNSLLPPKGTVRKRADNKKLEIESSSKDSSSKDNTSKDNTSKDNTSKDNTSKDNTSKDNTSKDNTSSATTETSTDKSKGAIADKKKKRKDSREEAEYSPTPIASVESMEVQYEKLLVVERVPPGEVKSAEPTKQLSVVTQEQFSQLMAEVKALQKKFGPIAKPGFTENEKLMNELRRGASLTDAMAALQLSARVEAAEKTLEQMLSLITDIAQKIPDTGVSELALSAKSSMLQGAESTSGVANNQRLSRKSLTGKARGQDASARSESRVSQTLKDETSDSDAMKKVASRPSKSQTRTDATIAHGPVPTTEETPISQGTLDHPEWITKAVLDEAMNELHKDILKELNGLNNRSAASADNAVKIVLRLEGKLNESLELGYRMEELEKIVKEYVEQINNLDTGLSSQMTNYQEQVTQMQYDLDTALEAMAESLANTGGDTSAVTELNSHFTSLQVDFDNANLKQKELQNIQNALAFDLQNLWKQIENLRDTKSDRDELADALKDKVGIGALNGILSQAQFDAVRGDFEKRISAAYNKFNNQEYVWQKAIDDLQRHLNEKADLVQVIRLRDDINSNLEMLRGRLKAMLEIVGEPKAAAITRKIHRDANCLSCSTPAHMEVEETQLVPALPPFIRTRPPVIGAEAVETIKEEKNDICYPGYPIPHAATNRAHVCNRYCGGSHTLLSNAATRVPAGVFVKSFEKEFATAVGTDGKSYINEICKQKPCLPCNQAKPVKPNEPVQAPAAQPRPSSEKLYFDEKEPLDSVSRTPEMIEDCYCES